MKHNLKDYTDEMLIDLCKPYKYSKEIPRWLYSAIHHRGIQDRAQAHLINLNPQRKIEDVRQEALKYIHRGDFQKKSPWAYQWACKHGVLNDICAHMVSKGNLKHRCVYVATFADGYAYVGLTFATKDRWHRHLHPSTKDKPSPVYIHMMRTQLEPHFEQITDYMPASEAAEEEKYYIKEYSKSWQMLNLSDGGELGSSSRKWTKKNIFYVVKTCNTYLEFCEKYPGAYGVARKNKWLEEIQLILPREREIWTEEHIKEILSTCTSYNEARIKYGGALNAAKDLGILDVVTAHLSRQHEEPYTEEQITAFVSGLKYKSDFIEGNRSMVNAAIRMGIYEKITAHLIPKPHGKTIEEYVELASTYTSRGEFKKDHPGAYAVIRSKEGWAKKCFAHMTYLCRVNLSDEDILMGASKYSSINDWQINDGGAYNAAKKRGLFDLATKHMNRPEPHNKKSDSYYIEVSSRYEDLKTFRKECPNEYAAINNRGKDFLKQCTGHMRRRRQTYTKEEAFKIAKAYTTKMELHKANLSVYTYLYTRGWLNECFPQNVDHPKI